VVAGVNYDLTATDVVEFCCQELNEPVPNPMGTEYVSQAEWIDLIADVAGDLMEPKQ
jgi:hypothetical protein